MTGLGSPDVSSQSVSGFSSRKGGENPEADWDHKLWEPQACHPSPVLFVVAENGWENIETDRDDFIASF